MTSLSFRPICRARPRPFRMLLRLSLLLALIPGLARAQTAPVVGTVRAEGSREPIPYATVQIPSLGRGVTADERGYFVLPELPAGEYRLQASAPAFNPVEIGIRVGGAPLQLEVLLPPRPVELAPIQVQATREGEVTSGVGPGPIRIDATVVDAIPALAEADVLRTLQTLPSVQAASDFSSALYVRGGSPDQNLMLLDGAPLFNPYHLGGVFGAIDPDAIASVSMLPGAFPARLGDRLSSAIEIRTREGGRDRVRGNGGVGLISSRAGVDGPLPGDKGSYLISARRTYLDLFTDAAEAAGLIDFTLPYSFSDANLKLTHDVGALGRLSASLHLDAEDFRIPEEEDFTGDALFEWGTRSASLNYWQPIGSLVAEFRTAISSFDGSFDAFNEDPIYEEGVFDEPQVIGTRREQVLRARTTIRNVLAAADLTWYQGDHTLRSGAQFDNYLFDYDIDVDPSEFSNYVPNFELRNGPNTFAAFVEDQWSPTDRFELRAGLRVLAAGERGTAWMPRLAAQFALSDRLRLSFGAGRYAQVLHSLRDEESLAASLVAYDLLAAVPPEIGLTTGEDVVLGAEWSTSTTSIRVDGYSKWLHKLPLVPVPDELLEAPVIVTEGFEPGEGTSRGFEFLGRHRRGRAEFSLGYALLFAERTLNGESYAPRFERRHTVDAMAVLPFGGTGQFSARMAFATGQPFTPATGIAQPYFYNPINNLFFSGETTIVLGEHNSARLPGYFRLDLAARRSFERRWFGRPVQFTPYLQVLNALNTRNVLFAEPSAYGFGGPELTYAPQLPVLPTLGIEWKF